MNNLYRKTVGREGEEIVVEYLLKNGYKIIDRNFLVRGGELDIVAKHEETIVFIEVKSVKSEVAVRLEERLSKKQIRKLKVTAEIWLQKNRLIDCNYRFDYVGLVLQNGVVCKLLHLKEAIY